MAGVRIECWCGKFIGGDPNGTEVSTGACPKCAEEMRKQIEKDQAEFERQKQEKEKGK